MDRYFLNKKAYSLVELAVAMGIIAILTSAVVPMAVRAVEIKAGEKTITEVGIIQTAAQKYYTEHLAWPNDLTQLQSLGYLSPLWSLKNPWNNAYQVNFASKNMTVTTQVPSNLSGMLMARLPQASAVGNVISSVTGASDKNIIAAGVITAWSGLIADIPLGWVLCDGQNGTPDLRDKFIVGARQDDDGVAKTNMMGGLNQTGGNISHHHGGSVGSHILTIAEVPSLQVSIPMFSPNQASPNAPTVQRGQSPADGSLSLQTNGGGQAHAHTLAVDYHVPPYYALAFIMKL